MAKDITGIIRDKYAETALSGLSSDNEGIQAVAEAFGYSTEELQSIPAEANMGLSCGNPTAMASLKPGETVVDLGSGGGLDVFLAAQSVGPEGLAIGVDMTQEMIDLAKRNAQQGPDGKPYSNVDFRLGTIDALPLSDGSADVVISNCVINLASDKAAVFREIFRVLKPGGRLAVSDIALKQTLPQELAENVAALVGCIAGAIMIDDYVQGLQEAGFEGIAVVDSGRDLTAYAKAENQAACCSPNTELTSGPGKLKTISEESSCCGPTPESLKPMHRELGELFQRYDVNEYAASVRVFALKP